jgi:hypothetical protein
MSRGSNLEHTVHLELRALLRRHLPVLVLNLSELFDLMKSAHNSL